MESNERQKQLGQSDEWLGRFSSGRTKMDNSSTLKFALNSLPKFVIETSPILGASVFMDGVVIFSDIQCQAVIIGVSFSGGLRIIASVIPFQSAITGMKDGTNKGRCALQALKKIYERDEEIFGRDETDIGSLRFQNVYFSYEESSEPVLKDLSFKDESFIKVAIVGPSCAAKLEVL